MSLIWVHHLYVAYMGTGIPSARVNGLHVPTTYLCLIYGLSSVSTELSNPFSIRHDLTP